MNIYTQCSSCDGTGLYRGMCESKGTAVICLDCDGTGCEIIYARKFTGRKRLKHIKEVKSSRGKSIVCCGGSGESITYKEFLKVVPSIKIKREKK